MGRARDVGNVRAPDAGHARPEAEPGTRHEEPRHTLCSTSQQEPYRDAERGHNEDRPSAKLVRGVSRPCARGDFEDAKRGEEGAELKHATAKVLKEVGEHREAEEHARRIDEKHDERAPDCARLQGRESLAW